MKKFIYLLLIGFSLSGSLVLQAQQDEQMSLYMYNPLYYNPAYAGTRNAVNVTFLSRFQWVGYKGAPNTQWLSVHAPVVGQTLGLGAHITHDRIGARDRTSAYFDISAGIRLNKKGHRLAFGLSGGVDISAYNFTNLTVTDPDDPFYGNTWKSVKPNFGAGVYYYGERFYLGLSSPRILESNHQTTNATLKMIKRHFFFSGGYVFKLNSVWDLKPYTLVKVTPYAPVTFDINLSALAYKKYWFGIMYRYNESMGLNASALISKMFTIGYAFDFPLNKLRGQQYGSHEIVLQFDLTKNRKAGQVYSPRYF